MKTKNTFFLLHLLLVTFISFFTIIISVSDKFDKKVNTEFYDKVMGNKFISSYTILSGINTGYGFYGSTVGTNKFCYVYFERDTKNYIEKNLWFKNKGNYDRFCNYLSKMANDIADLRQKETSDSLSAFVKKLTVKYYLKGDEKISKYVKNKIGNSDFEIVYIATAPSNIWQKEFNKKTKIIKINLKD